ncbi:DUF2812 domain-containing protein [Pseudoflavonifractor sp. AF19-9AC]|uniref:DUF2812 domain-containing protein n=1 Tax=Pseudoflavonifractor sp. AF19-9AC TaxID=2292244 RepID=UPI000E4A62CF|nr:DUF2812 domain-containing protein [Pseudoflavonifractor sp. AF19-9AC]RHR11238.1 DUF2812 domain-containing protein [Pseudoflavonifractor sp. AF19-9AC]
MKDSKRDFIPFSLYDRTGMAAHLEKRAAQGWLLDRVSPWGWRYRRIQPQRLHYAVTYYPKNSEYAPAPSEEQLTFQDFCAHTGWKLAAAFGPHQFYYNAEEDPVPIQTDPGIELVQIGKAFRRALPIYIVFLLLGLYMGCSWLWTLVNRPIDLLSSTGNLFTGVCWLLLFVYFAADLTAYLLWRRKAKAAAQLGEFVPTCGCHRVMQVGVVLMLLSLAGWLLTDRTPVLWYVLVPFVLVTLLLYVVADRTKELLKRRKTPAGLNLSVTWALTLVLSFLLMGTVMYGMVRGVRSGAFSLDDGPPPVTLSDLDAIPAEDCQVTSSVSRSAFLSHAQYWMHTQPATEDYSSLTYTVVDVHLPWLYDACLNQLLHEKDDLGVFEEDEEPVSRYGYRAADPASWGAEQAWQLYTPEGRALENYILCWDNRLVVFESNPDGLTAEQMVLVGELLAPT